jgi:ferredoxin-thioredoxin reductase catalytic subunit
MGDEKDIRVLREQVAAFCKEAGYRLSPQSEEILQDIIRVKDITGDFHCPCQTQKLPETVCVCQAVRQGLVDLMGACFCGLILQP